MQINASAGEYGKMGFARPMDRGGAHDGLLQPSFQEPEFRSHEGSCYHLHSFAERHLEMEEQIRALAARSTAFSDMCTRFGRVWDSLNELDQEPMRTEEVQRELRHLETLMLAMAQQQMRV